MSDDTGFLIFVLAIVAVLSFIIGFLLGVWLTRESKRKFDGQFNME